MAQVILLNGGDVVLKTPYKEGVTKSWIVLEDLSINVLSLKMVGQYLLMSKLLCMMKLNLILISIQTFMHQEVILRCMKQEVAYTSNLRTVVDSRHGQMLITCPYLKLPIM